jgi:ubiquinone/menaquinone biosynthesis methyltransferase
VPPVPSRLEAAFTSPDAKGRHVRRLFATIADRYDLITRLLSWGGDARWKRRLLSRVEPRPGERGLDLACGTGDLVMAAVARDARVTGLDITRRMIELARRKPSPPGRTTWVVGDMTALPVAPSTVDFVTTGYGLRNVPDLALAIAEIHRVLKPGGRLGSLDFNRPESRWLRAVYLAYLTGVGATLGWVLHRDPDTYRYIPASIRRYPGARGVASLLAAAGFVDVEVVPVLGGLLTIHLARRAEEARPPTRST